MAQQSVLDVILNLVKKGDGVKQANKDLQEFGKGSKEAKGLVDKLSLSALAATGVIIGFGVKAAQAIARQIPILYELGDQYERQVQALNAYTGSAGAAQLATLRVNDAVGGGVNNLDAAAQATKLYATGLATTTKEAAQLTKNATLLGAAVGKDAKSAMEEFTLLLANQSILRLDNFGISSSEVRQRIVELMEANEDLNRSMAFNQAVMEISTEKAKELEAANFEASSSTEKLNAEFENLKIGIGTFIDQLAGPFIDNMANAKRANRELSLEIFDSSDTWDEYVERLKEAGLVVKDTPFREAANDVQWYSKYADQAAAIIRTITNDTTFFTEELFNQAKAADEAAVSNENLGDSYSSMALDEAEAKLQLQQLHTLLSTNLSKDLDDVQKKIGEQRDSIKDWRARIKELQGESYLTDAQKKELDGLYDKISDAEEKIGELEDAWDRQTKQMIFNLAEQQLAVDGFTQEEIDALAKLAGPEGFGLVDQAGQQLIQTVGGVGQQLQQKGDQSDYFVQKMRDVQGAVGDADSEVGNLRSNIAALPTSKNVNINVTTTNTSINRVITQYQSSGFSSQSYGERAAVERRLTGGYQHGGEFEVQGPPGPDRVPVSFMASPGEKVSVTPRGAAAPQGSGEKIGNMNVYLRNGIDLAMFQDVLQRAIG